MEVFLFPLGMMASLSGMKLNYMMKMNMMMDSMLK